MYVLIICFHCWIGGSDVGGVTTQEFESKETCEIASQALINIKGKPRWAQQPDMLTVCTRK